MTKKLPLVFTIIMIMYALNVSGRLEPTVQPNINQRFRIWHTCSNISGDYCRTELKVILCADDIADLDVIFQEIREFYVSRNGESDSLIIHVYKSRCDLQNGRELASKKFIIQKTPVDTGVFSFP